MQIILDSSVTVKLLARETGTKKAAQLFQARVDRKVSLIALGIMVYEVNQAIIRKKFKSATYVKKINELMQLINASFIEIIHPDAALLKSAQHIARIVTPPHRRPWSYDATFHALAVRENSQLVTADYTYIKRFDFLIA